MSRSLSQTLLPPNSSRVHLLEWAKHAASSGTDKTFYVLDAGAGDAPYRELFSHVSYHTADYAGSNRAYGHLDYICDLTDIPVRDQTYDLVFCSQVFEHLPDPHAALREFSRVLKPGGQIWISAPLLFEEHEQPHDYWRFTQFAWRHMARHADLELESLDWLEGFYGTLSYQTLYAARNLPRTWLVTRALMLVWSHRFARKDLRVKLTSQGMCKNYSVVMRKA